MKNPSVESVCIFGSFARSTTDELSDRDVLVVCDDSVRRNGVVEYWQSRGWAVSAYSPSRLLKTIEAGSLFVQHLRLEGIILEDKNGWLGDQLKRAQAKKSYEIDAMRSVLLAVPIERFEADDLIEGNLVVADLAYVAIRNFGICYLANKKRYIFDYSEIVNYLGIEFGLNAQEVQILDTLRNGKAAYRDGRDFGDVRGTIGELRDILSIFFVDRPLVEIDVGAQVRDLGGGYAILRDFEAFVVARFGCNGLVAERVLKYLDCVWRWIMDPRAYCWNIRHVDRMHLNGLQRFLERETIDGIELSDKLQAQVSNAVVRKRVYSDSTIGRLSLGCTRFTL